MHSEIATDLRAECARILARHFNSVPDSIAAIRVSTVARIDAYVQDAEDRAAACTCERVKGFEIDTRRDKPVHAMLMARRLERMRVEEAGA
jgi:hypothetical protein